MRIAEDLPVGFTSFGRSLARLVRNVKLFWLVEMPRNGPSSKVKRKENSGYSVYTAPPEYTQLPAYWQQTRPTTVTTGVSIATPRRSRPPATAARSKAQRTTTTLVIRHAGRRPTAALPSPLVLLQAAIAPAPKDGSHPSVKSVRTKARCRSAQQKPGASRPNTITNPMDAPLPLNPEKNAETASKGVSTTAAAGRTLPQGEQDRRQDRAEGQGRGDEGELMTQQEELAGAAAELAPGGGVRGKGEVEGLAELVQPRVQEYPRQRHRDGRRPEGEGEHALAPGAG